MKRIYIFILLLFSLSAYSQQDPLFTQYMFNKLLVNPAYAGSREMLTFDILDREQWIGIDGAPRTMTISAHLATLNRKVGLGAYLYRDQLGPVVSQGLMLSYAYRLIFDQSYFSFGLQGGFKYANFDWGMIRVKSPEDYYFLPQDTKKFIPDFNLGFYYESARFFAGLSTKQLLENEFGETKSQNGKTSFSRLMRHFYLMTGAAFPVTEKIVFRPSLLAKYVKDAPVQVDVNASFLFNDFFWIGASFRTQRALAFLTEFRITPKIRLGYSFDVYLNELQPYNYGSHEIRLSFDVLGSGHRMNTPRYF
jgi:type IX secretion system PorP/SprF family membrane protein